MTEPHAMMTQTTAPKLLTIDEVADMLQCCQRSVAAWTASGELTSVKLGRLRRYRPEDVEDFVRRNLSNGVPFPTVNIAP